jgi:hypothetical protein
MNFGFQTDIVGPDPDGSYTLEYDDNVSQSVNLKG